jgi:hypothetical protein
MLNRADEKEIGHLAMLLYRVLNSRLPPENSAAEFVADKLARIQARDALETIMALIARSQERSW